MGQYASLLFPSNAQQQDQPQDDVPAVLKYSARICGSVGSAFALGMGFWVAISIYPLCIIAGIYLVLASFLVLTIEAPCCCFFLERVQQLSAWAESKPYWQKAAFYVLIAIPVVVLCQGISAFLGAGLIFATGVLYGMMALGKKASREEMITRARSDQQINQEMKVNLMSEQSRPPDAGGDFNQI